MLDHCFITNDFAELPREPGNKTVARCWPLAFLQYEGLGRVSSTGFPDRFCLFTISHQFFIDIIEKSQQIIYYSVLQFFI